MSSVLRSVYTSTRKAQLAIKDLSRFRDIATVLARHGFQEVLERVPESLRIGPLRADPEALQRTLPQRVVGALADLGPTFVKFGQIMSTRQDVLPADLIAELQTLQDRVPPIPFSEIRSQLTLALGQPPEEAFASLEERPLASASIAQVHAAVLKTGEDVVVKVQRPHVRETVAADVSILHFLARQVEEIAPETKTFNLSGMVDEFERSISRETDFTVEAGNIQRFARNFAHRPEIKVPAVHRALTSETVLTMERIRGRKLTDLKDLPKAEMDALVSRFLSAAYQMMFHDGFFHGDLHPGNALLQDDGKLAFLDFGMVGRLGQEAKDKLIDVVFALQGEDLTAVARTFYRLGTQDGAMDYRAYESDVSDVMERHFLGRSMAEIQFGVFFRDLLEVAMRHAVRFPPEYTMLFKALVTAEGLAKAIAPMVNPVEEARPFVEAAIRERYAPDRLKSQLLSDGVDFLRFLRSLPVVVEKVLRDAERGELQVKLDGSDRVLEAIRSATRARDRATAGMLVGACVVAFGLLASEARLDLNLTAVTLVLAVLGGAGMALTLVALGRGR
jgi:ubiquinone biosynthesis protein